MTTTTPPCSTIVSRLSIDAGDVQLAALSRDGSRVIADGDGVALTDAITGTDTFDAASSASGPLPLPLPVPKPDPVRELALRRKVSHAVLGTSCVGLVDTGFAWVWGLRPSDQLMEEATLVLAGVVIAGIGICISAERDYVLFMRKQRRAPTTPVQQHTRKRYKQSVIASEALGLMSLACGIAPSCVKGASTISALYGASLGLNLLNVGFAVMGRYYARANALGTAAPVDVEVGEPAATEAA